ncbi:hypothetical protein WDU94_002977 [Cyamophila willieti]
MATIPLPKYTTEEFNSEEFKNFKRQFALYIKANELSAKSHVVKVAHLCLALNAQMNDLVEQMPEVAGEEKTVDTNSQSTRYLRGAAWLNSLPSQSLSQDPVSFVEAVKVKAPPGQFRSAGQSNYQQYHPSQQRFGTYHPSQQRFGTSHQSQQRFGTYHPSQQRFGTSHPSQQRFKDLEMNKYQHLLSTLWNTSSPLTGFKDLEMNKYQHLLSTLWNTSSPLTGFKDLEMNKYQHLLSTLWNTSSPLTGFKDLEMNKYQHLLSTLWNTSSPLTHSPFIDSTALVVDEILYCI